MRCKMEIGGENGGKRKNNIVRECKIKARAGMRWLRQSLSWVLLQIPVLCKILAITVSQWRVFYLRVFFKPKLKVLFPAIRQPQWSRARVLRLRGGIVTRRLLVWATALEPHHEAQVRPSGEDVAPELIVEVHVLIDKVYILFVRKCRVQTEIQQ